MLVKLHARPIVTFLGLLAALAGLLAFAVTTSPARASSYTDEEYMGYLYKVFVPSGYVSGTPIPLVVMLHGCSQDAATFAIDTEMNTYAEQYNFIVIYPQQLVASNAGMCWNWFDPAHQSRGSGEPSIIAGMVGEVKAAYSINGYRVYVAGMSAGAAMSVILGVTYPDVFAAIGESAGLEYKAGENTAEGVLAQELGGPDPDAQGDIAYDAMGAFKRVVPVIVFHGSMDNTVNPVNANQVISQWAQTNDRASDGVDDDNIDDTPEFTETGSVPAGKTYTHYIYTDSDTGLWVMEKYIVDGMSHRWSGGGPGGSIYVDPQGPEASLIMWQFFTAHPMPGGEATATPTALPCAVQFPDVPQGSTFYPYVRCLACRGVLGGFSDGTFKPGSNVTRGQLSKIVANAARFNWPVEGQTFEDVPVGSTYYHFIEMLNFRQIIGGYPCGGPGEHCGEGNRPYFRPNGSATRGQIAKIVSEAADYRESPGAQRFQDVSPDTPFYTWVQRLANRGHIGGYECGGPGEPCEAGNLPYFRPGDYASRGQTAKIVANTFFPGCETSTPGRSR